jgi:hypothetical protein
LKRASLGLVFGVLLAAVGCGSTKSCKQGTLLVTVTFDGTTSAADDVEVTVTVEGMAPKQTPLAHKAGATSGSIEIDFPGGYPESQRVDVTVVATNGGTTLGAATGTVQSLAAGCGVLAVNLMAVGVDAGTGKGGSGGGIGGRAGVGGTGGGGTGGRGTGGGGTAGGGSRGGTGGGGTAGGGSGGGTGGGIPSGVSLKPSADGFVQDSVSGVVGAWYVYGDSIGPNLGPANADFEDSACGAAGFTMDQCSKIAAPAPGQSFMPTDLATGEMCTSGTAALVIADASGNLNYSAIFGAGIGFNFNSPGGDAGAVGYFDMTPFTGISFDFSGSAIASQMIRVNLPFKNQHANNAPYLQGATQNFTSLSNGQHVVFHWSDIGGPMYLTTQTPPISPPAFDKTMVQAIQFQVFSNAAAAIPYSFCVSNLTLLTD